MGEQELPTETLLQVEKALLDRLTGPTNPLEQLAYVAVLFLRGVVAAELKQRGVR